MNILISPQVRSNDKIWYEVREDMVIVTINGITDSFDFSGMPNGKLQLYDSEGESMIETVLEEVPILGAEKTNSVLIVELLFSIDSNEKDERLLFPKPMKLDEFRNLMDELLDRKKSKEDVSEVSS